MKFKRRRLTLGQSRLPRGFQEPPIDRLDLIDLDDGHGDDGTQYSEHPWMAEDRRAFFDRALNVDGSSRSRANHFIDYVDPDYLPESARAQVSMLKGRPEFPRAHAPRSREYRLIDVHDDVYNFRQLDSERRPRLRDMDGSYNDTVIPPPDRFAGSTPRRAFVPTSDNPRGWQYAGGLDDDVTGGLSGSTTVLPPKKNIFGRLTKKARQVDFDILEEPANGDNHLTVKVTPRDRPNVAVMFDGSIIDKTIRRRPKRIFDISHAYTMVDGQSVPWRRIKNSALSKAQLKDASSYLKMNFPELQGAHGLRQTGIHSRTHTPQHVTFDSKRLGLKPFPKTANPVHYALNGQPLEFSPFVKDLFSRRPLKLGKMAWQALPAAVAAYTIGSSIKHSKDKE